MAQLALQVMKAIERKKFMRQMFANREQDMRQHAASSGENDDEAKFATFSKSYFSCSKKIPVLSHQVRDVLERRKEQILAKTDAEMNAREENLLMNLVDCFHLIHRRQDAIKRCIAQSVYYEEYPAFSYIRGFSDAYLRGEIVADDQPCYYILRGTVEVTYNRAIQTTTGDDEDEDEDDGDGDGGDGDGDRDGDGEDDEDEAPVETETTKQIFEPNVIYSHSAGEYLGLVSSFGPEHDFISPGTIYVKDRCEMLCIDRRRFHELMQKEKARLRDERTEFVENLQRVTGRLTEKEIKYLKEHLIEEKFEPNKVVLHQGVESKWLYFVREGRIHMYRQLPFVSRYEYGNYSPPPLVKVGQLDPGAPFGIETVVHNAPTDFHYVTALSTVVLKLQKEYFGVFNRQSSFYQNLVKYFQQLTVPLPTEKSLSEIYVTERKWLQYRRAASASVISNSPHFELATPTQSSTRKLRNPEVLIDKNRQDSRLVKISTKKRNSDGGQSYSTRVKEKERQQIYDEHRTAQERIWGNRFRMGYINQRMQRLAFTRSASTLRNSSARAKPATSQAYDDDDADADADEDN